MYVYESFACLIRIPKLYLLYLPFLLLFRGKKMESLKSQDIPDLVSIVMPVCMAVYFHIICPHSSK